MPSNGRTSGRSMFPEDDLRSDERVLVIPVTRRDGEVTCTLMAKAGMVCEVSRDLHDMAEQVRLGVGALVLTEAALMSPDMAVLEAALRSQPAWSDVPVLVLIRDALTAGGDLQALDRLGNLTVIDRPVSARSMISAVKSALRDRRKQYRIRDQMAEQALAEQALVKADRRKDEFLATLAHELRNPLAPIRTGLQILSKMPGGTDEKSRRLHEIMERQMVQLVKLIDELLEVSRISTGKVVLHKERVDMRSVIEVALEGSAHLVTAAGHTLDVELLDEPVWVYGDPARLAQVVSNLVNNAAKYTPNGGHISMRMTRVDGEVAVVVQDNGMGIPADMLEHVFDMFAQVNRTLDRSQGGLGIGLSLVKRLMELHGGSVRAESRGTDLGSRFTLRMPALEAGRSMPAARNNGHTETLPEKRLRVLVIDDNADAAETLAMLLEAHGHQTKQAHDAETGLEAAGVFEPQAVFCDIEMPGMNGYEVATRLRNNPRHAPALLVAVTGRGARDDRQRSLRAGFDLHLTKPVGYEAVRQALRRL
jgi:two-component system, sensor histidine kinase